MCLFVIFILCKKKMYFNIIQRKFMSDKCNATFEEKKNPKTEKVRMKDFQHNFPVISCF